MNPKTYLDGIRRALDVDWSLPTEEAEASLDLKDPLKLLGELRVLADRTAGRLVPRDAVQMRDLVGELEGTLHGVSAAAAEAGYEHGLADGLHLGLYRAAAGQAGALPRPSRLVRAVLGVAEREADGQDQVASRPVRRRQVDVTAERVADQVKDEIGRRINGALRRLAAQLHTEHPDLAAALADATVPFPALGGVQLNSPDEPDVRIRPATRIPLRRRCCTGTVTSWRRCSPAPAWP